MRIINLYSFFIFAFILFSACEKSEKASAVNETTEIFSGVVQNPSFSDQKQKSIIGLDTSIGDRNVIGTSDLSKKYDLELFQFSAKKIYDMGDVMDISGFIRNNGPAAYVGERISINYMICQECDLDTTLSDLIATHTNAIVPPVTVIPVNNSIAYKGTVRLNPPRIKSGANVIIIWPGDSDNDRISENDLATIKFFVR